MKQIEFTKTNINGDIIRARFIKAEGNKTPLVIMVTGDGPKGSNSLSWVNLPSRLLEHGISSLLFDFRGLGNSEGLRRDLSLTHGIEDFKLIFNSLKPFNWIDTDNIGIMASSFGATVVMSCPEIIQLIKVLGLKSPCAFLPDAYLNEISMEDYDKWIKTGYCEANGYNLNVLLDSFNYNTYSQLNLIKVPTFITHGDADEVVPIYQSLYIKALVKGEVELKIFKGGDHGYSKNWEEMAQLFLNFYQKNLLQKNS